MMSTFHVNDTVTIPVADERSISLSDTGRLELLIKEYGGG